MSDIRQGDIVIHTQSGESWYVVGLKRERNQLCILGVPPTIALISDCKVKLRGFGITRQEREIRDRIYGTDWDV